ncbi:MAG: ATP-binding protein [Methylophilaceae bacterium]
MKNMIELSTAPVENFQQLLTKLKNKFIELVGFSKFGSEHEQAIIRVIIISLILLYFNIYYEILRQEIPIFWALFLASSLVFIAHIRAFPANNPSRQILALLLDLLGTSYSVHISNEIGTVFIGVYLWLIIGYGLRYGSKTLNIAYGLSIAFFILSYTTNPFWQAHMPIFYGLLITLIGVPIHTMRLLAKLQLATLKAEQASQAKSQFLSHMSHEIRTPLNGIVGACNLINDNQTKSEQKELINVVKYSSELLVQLVSNVLDLTEIERGKVTSRVENFNLKELLVNTTNLFKPLTQSKGVEFSFNLKNETPLMLKGENLHIKQVLVNLIGNAIKFTEKGSITVNVEALTQSDNEAKIRFEVVDTGIGIPQHALNSIFESFTQADDSIKYKYGGTGLGTAISMHLVKLMGGQIGVESQQNVGSKFWFEITLAKNVIAVEDTNVASIADYKKPVSTKTLSILVAEDNPVNSMIITQVLKNANHEIDVVTNGSQALDKLESSKYDLMILDSNMPVMSGIEALQVYRTLNLGQTMVPAIILSADATKGSMDRAYQIGAAAYLTKPVQNDELLKLINDLVNPVENSQVVNVANFKRKDATNKRNVIQYLDIERIQSLGRLSQDVGFFEKLVKDFSIDTTANIKELNQFVQNQDYINISAIGHAIAGSATNLGLPALYDVAKQIDEVSPTMHINKIEALLAKFNQVFEESKLELENHIKLNKNNQSFEKMVKTINQSQFAG